MKRKLLPFLLAFFSVVVSHIPQAYSGQVRGVTDTTIKLGGMADLTGPGNPAKNRQRRVAGVGVHCDQIVRHREEHGAAYRQIPPEDHDARTAGLRGVDHAVAVTVDHVQPDQVALVLQDRAEIADSDGHYWMVRTVNLLVDLQLLFRSIS